MERDNTDTRRRRCYIAPVSLDSTPRVALPRRGVEEGEAKVKKKRVRACAREMGDIVWRCVVLCVDSRVLCEFSNWSPLF